MPYHVLLALLLATVLFAWLRGGRWERLAAATLVLNCGATGLVQDRHNLMGPQYGFLIVDAVSFVVLMVIALWSRLWWATWTAGFLLFGVCMHAAMAIDEKLDPYAYYVAIGIYSYLLCGAILIGSLTRRPPRPDRERLPHPEGSPSGQVGRRARVYPVLQLIALLALTAAIFLGSILAAPSH